MILDLEQVQAWHLLLATAGTFASAFFLGFKWVLRRADDKEKDAAARQDAMRATLESSFRENIAQLLGRLDGQEAHIALLQRTVQRYVRHVGVLEGLLKAHGHDIPDLSVED